MTSTSANDNQQTPGPLCLSPEELSLYVDTGELPEGRLDHFETCSICNEMIAAAAEPPPSVEFLTKIGSRKASKRSGSFEWLKMTAVAVVTFVATLSFTGGMSDSGDLRKANSPTASSESYKLLMDRRLEAAQRETKAMQYLVRFPPPVEVYQEKMPSEWSDVHLVYYLLSTMGSQKKWNGTQFDEASKRGFIQGIPRAIANGGREITASNYLRTLSARRYLSNFTDEEILDAIEIYGPMINTAEYYKNRFKKFSDEIRVLDPDLSEILKKKDGN